MKCHVLYALLICYLCIKGNCDIDSHYEVHRDNTFLQAAHGLAKAKGVQACWVCGLMQTSSQVPPYIAVPFTIPEYTAAYGTPSIDAPFYTVPMDIGPPTKIRLSYAPVGIICWVNSGNGQVMGNSTCTYTTDVGNPGIQIEQDGVTIEVPLPTRVAADHRIKDTDTMLALNGSMFVCGSTAYSYLPVSWSGSCYMAYVVPALGIEDEKHIKGDATGQSRSKRDLFGNNSPIATPTQRFFAAIIPGYGATVALDEIRILVNTLDAIANDSASGLSDLSHELYGLRTMVFQHQYLLDFLAVRLGGYCFFIKQHLHQRCCTYVPDLSANVTGYVKDIHTNVARLTVETSPWSLGKGLSDLGGSLFSKIIQMALPVLIPIVLIYIAIRVSLSVLHACTSPTPKLAALKAIPENGTPHPPTHLPRIV